jgi:hypothetical protein
VLYSSVNKACSGFQNTVDKGQYQNLVKPALTLVTLNFLGSMLCDFCLLWTAFVLLFTVPAVYNLKREMIDGLLGKMTEQIGGVTDLVFSKVPKYSDLKED